MKNPFDQIFCAFEIWIFHRALFFDPMHNIYHSQLWIKNTPKWPNMTGFCLKIPPPYLWAVPVRAELCLDPGLFRPLWTLFLLRLFNNRNCSTFDSSVTEVKANESLDSENGIVDWLPGLESNSAWFSSWFCTCLDLIHFRLSSAALLLGEDESLDDKCSLPGLPFPVSRDLRLDWLPLPAKVDMSVEASFWVLLCLTISRDEFSGLNFKSTRSKSQSFWLALLAFFFLLAFLAFGLYTLVTRSVSSSLLNFDILDLVSLPVGRLCLRMGKTFPWFLFNHSGTLLFWLLVLVLTLPILPKFDLLLVLVMGILPTGLELFVESDKGKMVQKSSVLSSSSSNLDRSMSPWVSCCVGWNCVPCMGGKGLDFLRLLVLLVVDRDVVE